MELSQTRMMMMRRLGARVTLVTISTKCLHPRDNNIDDDNDVNEAL